MKLPFLITITAFYITSSPAQLTGLLTQNTWLMCWSNHRLMPNNLKKYPKEIDLNNCLHQLKFNKDHTISYTNLINHYDPRKGCSNSFANFTGTWQVSGKKIYLLLEYNTYAETPALTYHYELEYLGNQIFKMNDDENQ